MERHALEENNMCYDDAHEFAKQELFKAVRQFMASNRVAAAVLEDNDIVVIVGERDQVKGLMEKVLL